MLIGAWSIGPAVLQVRRGPRLRSHPRAARLTSPNVLISSSLYRPAINRSVACRTACRQLSVDPRDTASSRSCRNVFASFHFWQASNRSTCANSVGVVQSYPGKRNFSVKEAKKRPSLIFAKMCTVCWLIGYADPRKATVVREPDRGGGSEAGIPGSKPHFSSAAIAVMTSSPFQASDGLRRVARFDGKQSVNPTVRL